LIPFRRDFKGMIDFIFASPHSLQRLGYLGGIDSKWISDNKIVGFPHAHVPSDHIPIMAQYALHPINGRQPAQQVHRWRRRSGSFSRAIERHKSTASGQK
jgi:mRNA deadenylase 3'-5' endonuclease subunit Ccr4